MWFSLFTDIISETQQNLCLFTNTVENLKLTLYNSDFDMTQQDKEKVIQKIYSLFQKEKKKPCILAFCWV